MAKVSQDVWEGPWRGKCATIFPVKEESCASICMDLLGMSTVKKGFSSSGKDLQNKHQLGPLSSKGCHDMNPNSTLFNSPIKHWKKDY